MAAMRLLETEGLSRHYGGVKAVDNASFTLDEGEVRAIIGPNGAGKTTLVGMICGRVVPSAGRIRFKGEDITKLAAPPRVMRGIVYTFQVTSIYRNLSCLDNVALAAQRRHASLFAAHRSAIEEVSRAALARVGLSEEANREAGTLPYGHQRLLEVAMGLALEPELLILDELTQGLAPAEIASFCDLIRDLSRSATILLIEHNLKVVLELAARITVMDSGRILAEGSPAEIEQHPAVQKAYLGQ
jgi:branched-chain amino acid transport system ATP-binding protein